VRFIGQLRYETVSEQEKLQLLKKVTKILDENNIEYWLEFGTLLGCIRDGKFIEWDSDIDLGVWCLDKIKELEQEFINKGLKLSIERDNRGCYTPVLKVSSEKHTFFHVDIMEFQKINDNYIYKFVTRNNIICRLANTLAVASKGRYYKNGIVSPVTMKKIELIFNILPYREKIRKIISEIDYFFSMKCVYRYKKFNTINVKFYDIYVKIPEDYQKQLLYCFGNTWSTPNRDFKDFNKRAKKINGEHISDFWEGT
jgi:hypothetical protein